MTRLVRENQVYLKEARGSFRTASIACVFFLIASTYCFYYGYNDPGFALSFSLGAAILKIGVEGLSIWYASPQELEVALKNLQERNVTVEVNGKKGDHLAAYIRSQCRGSKERVREIEWILFSIDPKATRITLIISEEILANFITEKGTGNEKA